ncbi:MAG TPA: serine/threonine-protein kinase [Kofleriaceae bacterium]|nr:serine/threonine-protein kinase [Kofleriaceae bacterium]
MTRYELLDRIGVGGMAEIFRGKAVAAGGFEKPVAIKRILPHLSQDKRFVELLIAEAKVLSLLKHRNIVQIFDVGLGDDGQYFLVMEYVDGKDLGGVQRGLEVRRRRMPYDLALHIGAEICEALEHAHSARAPDGKPMSLVHRDVSPSNVLLSRAGEIKLTDFGIAKRAEQEQTGHGAVRGKFAYISPEQARNEHVDPRSDVFSVAVVLWELITNRRLFSGLGDLEALRAVREAQVPRPTEIDPRLSPEVSQLLMAALSRDPKNRPTAGQFGAKLRSMRYALDVTVGDPASELAKIIDNADEVERQSQQMIAPQLPRSSTFDAGAADSGRGPDSIDGGEATVIRIRTADEFQMRDKDGAAVAKARKVIDRFEEEETRLAQLSGDQMRMLRSNRRDSNDSTAAPVVAAPRARRPTDEPTVAREPIPVADPSTPHLHFDSDESTRLVAPRDRRTPAPAPRAVAGMPPEMPTGLQRPRGGTPGPMPGTVHQRSGLPGVPPAMQPPARPPSPSPPVQQTPTPTPLPPSPMLPPTPMQRPQPPMPQPPMPQPQPPMPMPMQNQYPNWGVHPQLPPRGASPTAQDMYERPVYPQNRSSTPQVAGFQGPPKRLVLKPWMLVIGALIMAGLAFAITRAVLS